MSSNPNHPYSDYLRDIYMEIHSTFYPPPAVTIPKVNIPIPSLNSYLYSFQREKEAILEYEKEREKPKMKPPDLTSVKSIESNRNESTFPEKLPRPSMVPQEILQPSRISFPTTSKMEVLQPSTSISGGARVLNGLEEFERVTNVFDLMEIRSTTPLV
uniref:Uncharacterized protein n=1 Tax=Acrobeloides nanus TaxID=290746 RepID=A0A914EBE2_9BILA